MAMIEALRPQDLTLCSDQDLVALVLEGQGEAFRAIMQRYNQRLYRVARGVIRDEAEAEDVVQEAYVRAYAALKGFRGEAGLATWLTRIVLNEALGRIRSRRPTEELSVLDTHPEAARIVMFPGMSSMDDPESAAARAEVRRLLERAVDELPQPFRLVFILRDVDGMSIEETAEQLQIRPETVKTRLHRARRLLRENLDGRLASALKDTFPFAGARCARITDAVMARLGLGDHGSRTT